MVYESDSQRLYVELFRTWRKAYPSLSGPTIQQHVCNYWSQTFNKNCPQSFVIVEEKIRELHRRIFQRQPTLMHMWGKTNNAGTGAVVAKPSERKESNNMQGKRNNANSDSGILPKQKRSQPIVITIDDDENDGVKTKKVIANYTPEKLVVLEVVVLNDVDSRTADVDMVCDESKKLESPERNENLPMTKLIKTKVPEVGIEIEIEDGECSDSDHEDNKQTKIAQTTGGGEKKEVEYDIRIINIERLMERPRGVVLK